MRIKKLFTVPEGNKVTEMAFSKVLISSICGIILCMVCLTGTTWAWFTVGFENTGNVIQTADKPNYDLKIDGETAAMPNVSLSGGNHTVTVVHNGNSDDLNRKSDLYVIFTFDDAPYGYYILDGNDDEGISVSVNTEIDVCFSWEVSWFAPGNPDVKKLTDYAIEIKAKDTSVETTGSAAQTSEETEAETGAAAED